MTSSGAQTEGQDRARHGQQTEGPVPRGEEESCDFRWLCPRWAKVAYFPSSVIKPPTACMYEWLAKHQVEPVPKQRKNCCSSTGYNVLRSGNATSESAGPTTDDAFNCTRGRSSTT